MKKDLLKRRMVRIFSFLILGLAFVSLLTGIKNNFLFLNLSVSPAVSLWVGIISSLLLAFLSYGLWNYKNWSKTVLITISYIFISVWLISEVFKFSTIVFAGEAVTSMTVIFQTLGNCLMDFLSRISVFIIVIGFLKYNEDVFIQSPAQKKVVEQVVKQVLLLISSSSIFIVMMIFLFTFLESTDAVSNIGLSGLLTGTIWRPGAVAGSGQGQFGLVPMMLGSIYSTLGAVIIGVPLALATAILLSEIAPSFVRNIFRPAIELLAGIPSVIFGLFGMVVLAPLIRNIEINGNSGFGILNASIILAIMILPTIANVAEDAIRAVPDSYRQASLAMGATQWQTISSVVLPAARSGIIAAIILGIGRALGETMALIMVIGNSIAIPKPLDNNPFTLLLSSARTLTGNIAVEINYAEGVHRSALFFTGIVLFVFLFLINRLAHFLLQERQSA